MSDILGATETTLDRAQGGGGNGLAAIGRAASVFDTVPDLQIYQQRWAARCAHYQVLRAYYRGTVYDAYPELRKALKLYSGIRQIFGPLRRAVRVDVAKVPGEWTLPEDAPQPLRAAVEQIRAWSSSGATYSRAVQHGAIAGEFGLLMADDRLTRTARVIALRPDEVVIGTSADGTPLGLIIKPGLVDRDGTYEYAQLISPRAITTYRNGQPYAYDRISAVRPNLLGFVPLLLSPYIAGEDGVGENAFAGTQELLDRVNDATSQALDVIQRNAEPLTVFSGVAELKFDSENNAITLPKPEAKAYTLAPNLVIDHALALIDKVLAEFKNLLPQLHLDIVQTKNELAYDTVLTLLMELTDHVKDVRTHVDAAIQTAERWALQAGLEMGVFRGIDPAQHRLDAERPVIPPTASQKLALEAQQLGIEGAKKALEAPAQAPTGPNGQQQDRQPRDQR